MTTRLPLGSLAQAACASVDAVFEAEQVPWLQRLVDCPSYSRARADVEAAQAVVETGAAALGLSRTRVADPTGTFADHRLFATPGTGEEDRAVLLVGHVDTVFPRSLGFLHFCREPAADVIRGPGVLDMKSGLSAILFGLRAVREAAPGRWQELRLRFVCNSDEEVGSPSSAPLFARLAPRTSAALVFESGREGDLVVTRRKGGGTFELVAHGRAAHAGNRHADGVNAIHALARAIPRLEALTDYGSGVTVNVGLVTGGTAKNTVPDLASCTFDLRFVTRDDGERLVAALHELAACPWAGESEPPPRLADARLELRGAITRPPLEPSSASQRLREAYERCAAAVGLGVGEAPLQGGGSDANLLSAHGVPTIDGLGPFGRGFHQVEEWSSLESLRRRTKALACFLLEGGEGVGVA